MGAVRRTPLGAAHSWAGVISKHCVDHLAPSAFKEIGQILAKVRQHCKFALEVGRAFKEIARIL
jgi:hypothetical protein